MMNFLFWSTLKPFCEIFLLWFVFYRILVFFQGTRAFQVLKGITYLVILFLITQLLGFDSLNWLLTKFFAIWIIAIVILFQQELRQGLARLGQGHLFNIFLEESEVVAIIDELGQAAAKLSEQKTGCLIAIEREAKLKTYIDSGIPIDGLVSSEIVQTIFRHDSPMHDGGLVIRGQRILAAACLFPLSENQSLSKIIGTRHRAALGLTEQTDAVVLMVSEETGEISVACDGKFIPITGPERLQAVLKDLLFTHSGPHAQKNIPS
ncbi:MAG: TIGR00159 family protein [Candidatus Omnitrophica bacterium]|nr:TIGR00159 family protein [Candidatus Omnitrophota bacterium]